MATVYNFNKYLEVKQEKQKQFMIETCQTKSIDKQTNEVSSFFMSIIKRDLHMILLFKVPVLISLKGEFTFFIRELDVPPLGESNLMGPKNPSK